MALPEEETDHNLQNLIDAVVLRKTSSFSSPESGELPSISAAEDTFPGEEDKDEPAPGLFVIADDDMPNVYDVPKIVYAPDTAYVPDVESASDYEYAVDYENTVNYEDAADDTAVAENEAARIFSYAVNSSRSEGRLIFLSRTLAGLIDLFLIALFSGGFLCLTDYFTNAPMLSSINAVNFTALFLMVYFLYSIFFLGTNSQTIGMMAADLRVVGINKNHSSISQVVCRSVAFLFSLSIMGIGLLAGIFSRKYMCLHDRLSGTRVVRT